MKPTTVIVLIVAAFLIGGMMCRGSRGNEAAQRSADSTAVVIDSLEARDARRAVDSLQTARRLVGMQAQNRLLLQRGNQASLKAESLAAQVVDTASLVSRPLYDATVETYRGLVQVREAERDSARAEVLIWKGQWAAVDSSRNAWRGIAQYAQAQWQASLKRHRWGCVGGVTASLGYGFIGDRAGVGTVAGVGVTCGKRL